MDEIKLERRAKRRVRGYGLAKRRPTLALMASNRLDGSR